MQDTLARLLTLPDPLSEVGEEIDYPALAFSPQELQDMVDLLNSDFPGGAVSEIEWDHATIHSWRALGSTGEVQYLDLFLSLLRPALEIGDELFLDEFAHWVSGMGTPALAPLLHALANPDEEDVAFLEQLASTLTLLTDPDEHRDLLTTGIVPLLERQTNARDLNAYLIGILLELKAVEHLDLIRTLYQENLVNVVILGDLEGVEMNLGTRTKRSTPTPNLAGLEAKLSREARRKQLGPLPDEKDHLAVLDYLLQLHGDEDSMQSAVELDGFLLACLAAPTLIPPSTYVPFIWDRETADMHALPAWESEQEARLFYQSIQTLHNEQAARLHDGAHSPLGHLLAFEGQEIPLYTEWCLGVEIGIELWGGQHKDLAEELLTHLVTIVDLESQETPPTPTATGPALERSLDIIQAVFDQRTLPAPHIREAPKTGRNDPCPCGSGKKYKHCCMN